MPIVSVIPKNLTVLSKVAAVNHQMRARLKVGICETGRVEEADVIINLLNCPFLDPDPMLADLLVYADACPNEKLEPLADMVRDKCAEILTSMGFSVGMGAEFWLRFLPGSWAQVKGDKIVGKDDHTRKKGEPQSPWKAPNQVDDSWRHGSDMRA